MPQITLEYSANAQPDDALSALFARLHHALATVGKISIGNCKSRAYVANDYLVGTGEDGPGFVHLDVRFLEGRSPELIEEIGLHLLSLLKDGYASASARLDLQITVEIRDIKKSRYTKFPAGTFTQQVPDR